MTSPQRHVRYALWNYADDHIDYGYYLFTMEDKHFYGLCGSVEHAVKNEKVEATSYLNFRVPKAKNYSIDHLEEMRDQLAKFTYKKWTDNDQYLIAKKGFKGFDDLTNQQLIAAFENNIPNFRWELLEMKAPK